MADAHRQLNMILSCACN